MKPDRSSPLPAKPRPGPGGERARAATPEDAPGLVALVLEALAEGGVAHKRDLVEWAVQASVHDPLRGLFVLCEHPGEQSGSTLVGVVALEAVASVAHGWSARLACIYVRPQARRQGVGGWLLEEALELARYHGLNHLECAVGPEDPVLQRLLASAGFRSGQRIAFEVELRPLYDDD